MMKDRSVVFCVTGMYIMLATTAITSLVKNYRANLPLKILVLIEDVAQEDADFIRSIPSLYERPQISVDFWQPPYDLTKNVSDAFTTGTQLPKMILWRLFLPYYFPDYDQIAYLDNDVLITTDINDLFDQMNNSDTLGGVLDYEDATHPEDNRAKQFFLPDTKQYINSGVFVTNSASYRDVVPYDHMIDLINRRNYPYGDQSIINIAFYNHIRLLPWRFNLQYDIRILQRYKSFDPTRIEEIEAQLNKPGIIHFASNGNFPSPWQKFVPTTPWERLWWSTFSEIRDKQLASER